MKKLLLISALTIASLVGYSQSNDTNKSNNSLGLQQLEWGYGEKKEKPKASVTANELGEYGITQEGNYFAMKFTDEDKAKLNDAKNTSFNYYLGIFSDIISDYEGRYLYPAELIDGNKSNAEAEGISIYKATDSESGMLPNIQIEGMTKDNLYGNNFIFLHYTTSDGKKEQVAVIKRSNGDLEQVISELKEITGK
ncbi:MAG: hypothetical protein ACP5N3_02535 [Candidatus Nanoarchaeia archaeon]